MDIDLPNHVFVDPWLFLLHPCLVEILGLVADCGLHWEDYLVGVDPPSNILLDLQLFLLDRCRNVLYLALRCKFGVGRQLLHHLGKWCCLYHHLLLLLGHHFIAEIKLLLLFVIYFVVFR